MTLYAIILSFLYHSYDLPEHDFLFMWQKWASIFLLREQKEKIHAFLLLHYVCLHQQATADTCRMMGNRAFMDLISVNEIHKSAVEPQDVICMRDYMQVENKHPSNYFTTRFL